MGRPTVLRKDFSAGKPSKMSAGRPARHATAQHEGGDSTAQQWFEDSSVMQDEGLARKTAQHSTAQHNTTQHSTTLV
jgi:hypothetical protein